MPQGETFWNPYRWVPTAHEPVRRERPAYHHCWQGLAGRLYCTLEALTPFLINDGKGLFIKSRKTQQPFIPATTLKGMTRVLAELVGNACVPFPKVTVDSGHRIEEAAVGEGATRKLDPAAPPLVTCTTGRSLLAWFNSVTATWRASYPRRWSARLPLANRRSRTALSIRGTTTANYITIRLGPRI